MVLASRTLRLGVATAIVLGLATAPVALAVDSGKAWSFNSFEDYLRSDLFRESEGRCGTPEAWVRNQIYGVAPDPSDCNASSTNPSDDYLPDDIWQIDVVVHILMDNSCNNGQISDALVQTQIDILNEDFQAIMGSNGENGNDSRIVFALATEDPQGNPTNGITRSCNTTWYNDGGQYYNSLAWDPNRYLNIYTNNTFALGYVPFLPADAGGIFVGGNSDRVVVYWQAFGLNGPIGPPYNKGRTATHEVGHYLGLEHTFNGGCGIGDKPGCYTSGDLICDTNPESSPTYSPCFLGAKATCGSTDPSDNYMDYSDDLCMEKFTIEQVRRNRCTMQFYRPDLINNLGPGPTVSIDSITPCQANTNNTWNLSGATPNGDVTVECNVQGFQNIVTVGTDTADAAGFADVGRFIPPQASGRSLECLVIDEATGGKSPRIIKTFP